MCRVSSRLLLPSGLEEAFFHIPRMVLPLLRSLSRQTLPKCVWRICAGRAAATSAFGRCQTAETAVDCGGL